MRSVLGEKNSAGSSRSDPARRASRRYVASAAFVAEAETAARKREGRADVLTASFTPHGFHQSRGFFLG